MTQDYQQDIDDVAAIEVVPQILEVLHQTTGMGFCAVARVTPERWIACAVHDTIEFGLEPGGELQVETTICHEIRQSLEPVVIDSVAVDPHWSTHHTPLQYGFQSYISVPIILSNGSFFGTLCAIDPRPASVANETVTGMTRLFANLIARHLDGRRRLDKVEQELVVEQETSQLRDQFIGVLGHDIKNPIASIAAGARLLRKSVDDNGREILTRMEQSVARVSNIVDNVLDFARGVSGSLANDISERRLDATLEEIIAEFEQLNAGRAIERFFSDADTVAADHPRIAQLFANLLSNALTHGSRDGYVRAGVERDDGVVRIWVANQGTPIPEEMLARMFEPFKRRGENSEGLGLGLYIASQIARAHGGVIEVRSNDEETRFTVSLPVGSLPQSGH